MSQKPCPNCGHLNRPTARFCAGCAAPLASTVAPSYGLGTGQLTSQHMLKNRYLIVRKVGQGGMGAVYQVTDTHLNGRICAVKEMSDAAITNPLEKERAVQNYRQEAETLARLEHPNLPQVIDFFEEGGKHYLVMEFVPGETLEDKVERQGGPLPEDKVLQWATQLCDVLTYLHEQQQPIIFRDLKPANVMVTPRGQVKLIDFGIVRLFKPGKKKDTVAMGTPGYTPPEQYGHAQTDPRSDIFALGATLLRLLTGYDPARTPFSLPATKTLNPGVSDNIAQAVERALQVNPNKRWASAREMKTALLQNRPAMSRPKPPIEQQRPYLGPTRTVAHIEPRRASRPTTRLLMATAGLSNVQLTLGLGGLLVAVVLGVWLLAEPISQIGFLWENLQVLAAVAPLTYAAAQRRWVAGLTHALVTGVGGATLWARLGYSMQHSDVLLASALISGLAVEVCIWLLARIKDVGETDDWKTEASWLAFTGALGAMLASGIAASPDYLLKVGAWIAGAILGAVGWFLGDMIQQYLWLRQTGLQRER